MFGNSDAAFGIAHHAIFLSVAHEGKLLISQDCDLELLFVDFLFEIEDRFDFLLELETSKSQLFDFQLDDGLSF